MATSIFLKDSFDSAHWLPRVSEHHKCRRMHGHTYRVEMLISASVGLVSGFVGDLDYADIKQAWGDVKNDLDHHTLNEVAGLENPTCELIARFIGERMISASIPVTSVRLNETEHCGAIWTA